MNRFNWIYVANNGLKYHVGLMHSPTKGHLLVYCNSKIILIDFFILESKSYSIFIDEQLCEIIIERKGNEYLYGFEVNTEADTPLNNRIKKIERKHLMQSFLVIGALLFVIAAFVIGMNRWNTMKGKAALADKMERTGQETHARILISEENEGLEVSYFFLVDGKAYTIEEEFSDEKKLILETGLPLERGDEFVIKYIPQNPRIHVIDYTRPTQKQLAVYQDRAVSKYLSINPGVDSSYVHCLAETAYDLKGLSGYADFYFLNTSPRQNPNNNMDSFKRLVRDTPFKKRVAEKCDLLE